MLTTLTQLLRGPEISCTALSRRSGGQLDLRGQAPASRGRPSWAPPLVRLGAGDRPGRESQVERSERAPAADSSPFSLVPQDANHRENPTFGLIFAQKYHTLSKQQWPLRARAPQRPSRIHTAATLPRRSKSPIKPAKTGSTPMPRTTLASRVRSPNQSSP
jgi:hypothetical protein